MASTTISFPQVRYTFTLADPSERDSRVNVFKIEARFNDKQAWYPANDLLWDVLSYNIPDAWFIEEAENQMMELAAA